MPCLYLFPDQLLHDAALFFLADSFQFYFNRFLMYDNTDFLILALNVVIVVFCLIPDMKRKKVSQV